MLIGASLSEPHIDEFVVNFIYIYISVVRCAVSHFRLLFCAFLLRHALFRKRLEPRVVFSEGTKNSHGWMDSAMGVPACWTYVSCVEVTRPITSGYSDGG